MRAFGALRVVFERRCRKESRCRNDARDCQKRLTARPTQIKTGRYHQRVLSSVCGPLHASDGPQKSCLVRDLMHLSFYLMIVALVILGAEVAYALYQLANLTL
jgi:hypothetical protein